MSTSIDHLLPAAAEAVRCSPHTRSIAVDPGGTAFRADLVILVTTPRPWPKPAVDHPLPAAVISGLAATTVPHRVLATLPRPDDGGGSVGGSGERAEGTVGVTVFRRRGGSASSTRYRVPAGPGAVDALRALGRALADGDAAAVTAVAGPPLEHRDPADPAVLLCTQGSHDVCCGADGERLASQLDRGPGRGGSVEVWRVSHTGGHRFAPTALTLPDGRMWAWLDEDDLTLIRSADRAPGSDGTGRSPSTPPPADLVGRCRGWWGVDGGPAQVAERAVLAEVGWSFDGTDRQVRAERVAAPDGAEGAVDAVSRWIVDAGDRSWRVGVERHRVVPTIACREAGGQPAKAATEYRAVAVTPLPDTAD